MTAATAPVPPAAGHAREPRDERSSRTTMTKSISRSQVRLIALTSAIFCADEARDAAHQPRRHAPARPPLVLTASTCYKVIGGS